jgi:hypothetical protein
VSGILLKLHDPKACSTEVALVQHQYNRDYSKLRWAVRKYATFPVSAAVEFSSSVSWDVPYVFTQPPAPEFFLGCLTCENGYDEFFRNVGNKLPSYTTQRPRNAKISIGELLHPGGWKWWRRKDINYAWNVSWKEAKLYIANWLVMLKRGLSYLCT